MKPSAFSAAEFKKIKAIGANRIMRIEQLVRHTTLRYWLDVHLKRCI
jgi:hypothetical protein